MTWAVGRWLGVKSAKSDGGYEGGGKWRVHTSDLEVDVVGLGVGEGEWAEEGQEGERGTGEGGFAAAMAQKGQLGL